MQPRFRRRAMRFGGTRRRGKSTFALCASADRHCTVRTLAVRKRRSLSRYTAIMSKDAARLVLVVEDDVSVRRPLVKFLEMHGFAVVTAETSDEGLDALKKNRLVAAVVDLRLRRGSGRDVVMASPPDVPVIIFSGVPSESAELERLRPRTRLIEKPYSLVLLVETLEEMLAETGSQNLHS
jgi:DNA-binding NtrC family response regulator